MPTNMPAPAKPPMSRPSSGAPKGGNAAAIGVVALLVGLVAGYGAGRVSTGTSVNPMAAPGSGSGSYQDGYEAAHKKLLASGLIGQVPTNTMSLTGTIKSVQGDTLTLDIAYRSQDPLDQTVIPQTRTVKVASDAKIQETEQVDPATFEKEFNAWSADQGGAGHTPPPTPVTLKDIALSDLKVGDSVTVSAASDILKAASFTATQVVRNQPLAGGPGPAPAPIAPTPTPTSPTSRP